MRRWDMAQKLQNKLRIGRQQGILLIMKGVIGILCIILLPQKKCFNGCDD